MSDPQGTEDQLPDDRADSRRERRRIARGTRDEEDAVGTHRPELAIG